ncbi:MGA_1079 family surface serine endopeptidase [Mycoplasmopsis meleagridis]|uniref:MGA_1079 family surface serine endopeptidase n=1 Tax=Mycoplasmopsis meleagridis TaxID=29561 RepID=UPI003A8C67F3
MKKKRINIISLNSLVLTPLPFVLSSCVDNTKTFDADKDFNDATISFSYSNSSLINASEAKKDNIIANVSENNKYTFNVTDVNIDGFDDSKGILNVSYYLTLNYENKTYKSSKKNAVISNFKVLDSKINNQDDKQLNEFQKAEKNRLDSLLDLIELNYLNAESTLPSEFDLHNVMWQKAHHNQAKINKIQVLSYDDNLGQLKLELNLSSTKDNYENVVSDSKVFTYSKFDSLNKRKVIKFTELTNLSNDSSIKDQLNFKDINRSERKASSLTLEELTNKLISPANNTKIVIENIDSNDEKGTISLTYKLNYQDKFLNVSSNSKTIDLTGFKTNKQEKLEKLEEENRKINNDNFEITYPNIQDTFAIDAQSDLFALKTAENVKLINPEIISFDNEKGIFKLQYQLQNVNDELNHFISNTKETKIGGFKQGLSWENLINKEQTKLNSLAINFDYPDKDNILAKDAKITNITNNLNNPSYKINEIKNLSADENNGLITFDYQLVEDNFYNTKVYSSWINASIKGFKNIAKYNAELEIDDYFKNYKSVINNKLTNHPNIKLYSTSLSSDNAKFFLDLTNNKNIDVKVENIHVDENDINKVHYTLKATKDGAIKTKEEELTFSNNLNEILDKVKYSDLNSLFVIDYKLLNQFAGYDLRDEKNANIFNLIFKKKFKKISNVFDYEIDKNTIYNQISDDKKVYTLKGRQEATINRSTINANVNLKFGNTIVKTFNNLPFKYDKDWEDLTNKTNLMAFFNTKEKDFSNSHLSYNFSSYFLNKYQVQNYKFNYGQKEVNGQEVNKNIEDALKDIATEIKNNNLAQYSNVDIDKLVFAKDEISKQLLLETIKKIFDFNTNGWTIEELIPTGKGYTKQRFEKSSTYYTVVNNANLSIYLYLKLTKDDKTITIPLVMNSTYFGQDTANLDIINLVLNNEAQKIILLSDYNFNSEKEEELLASDAYEKLNQIYIFPKSGAYEIKVLPLNLTDFNGAKYDNNKGYAYISFGLYKNNEFTGLKTNAFKYQGFKTFTKTDIKPLNGKDYTAQDFQPIATFIIDKNGNKIEQKNDLISDSKLNKWKEQIDKINSTNFTYRLAQGNVYNLKDQRDRRTIDAGLFVSQKAFNNLDKLLVFNSTGKKDSNSYLNISPLEDQDNNMNLSQLGKDFYFYFYDTNGGYDEKGKGWLTFKMGFISKTNSNVRYTSGKEIKIVNLENDYKLDAYPTALINNLTYEDLNINHDKISQTTINEFSNDIKNSTANNSKKYLTLQDTANYHGFKFNNKDNLQIRDVKILKDSHNNQKVFIRLKYVDFVGHLNNKKTINGDIWYELSGFKNQAKDKSFGLTTSQILDQLNADYYMKKAFLSDNYILRRRIIELNYKDNLFKVSEEKRKVTCLFKKDYFMPLLGKNSTNKDAKINFHFNTNLLYIDNDRFNRIVNYNKGLNFSINWDELVSKKVLTFTGETDTVNNIKASYKVTFLLADEGIKFTYELTDNNGYKIVGDKFASRVYYGNNGVYSASLPEKKFDPEQAVFFSNNLGALVNIEYANKTANEKFNEYETNTFDYNHITVTPDGMPYYIYNEGYNHGQLFKYDPNQMLPYKWHEGYKLDREYGHLTYTDTRFKEVVNRSISLSNGSALFLGKVNNDPEDGRYYLVTNHHVLNNESLVDTPWLGSWKKVNIFNADLKNEIFSNNTHRNSNNSIWTKYLAIWTGKKNKSIDGTNQNVFRDLTIFMIDINDVIKTAKSQGKYATARWYENIKHMPNMPINDYNKDNYYWILQALNRNNKSWESKPIFTAFRMFTGFPGLMQVNTIMNRISSGENAEYYGRNSNITNLNYNPLVIRGGQSGTGIVDDEGNYIASINSAVAYWAATAWVNYHNSYNGNNNNTVQYNYFGLVNDNPLKVLDQKNTNSLSLNVLKMSANDPTINPPYWITEPKHMGE